MLSSVEPRDLFLGKIIGLGSLGLTQIAIWGVMLFIVGLSSSLFVSHYASLVRVTAAEVIYFVVFFVLGFLMYAAIFSVIGAVCTTEQDAPGVSRVAGALQETTGNQ